MKLKYIITILAIACLSCNSAKQKNLEPFYFLAKDQDAIVISCVKCNCIIAELNKIYKTKPALLEHYKIIGDSTCLEPLLFRNSTTQMPQARLDSISTDFYNLLILQKENGKITARMLETENAGRLASYLQY